MSTRWLLLLALLVACGSDPAIAWAPAPGLPLAPPLDPSAEADGWDDDDEPPGVSDTLRELRDTAPDVAELVASPWVRQWLGGTQTLDDELPRSVGDKTVDYYKTKYGSPLAYARALDLVAAAGMPSPEGARVFDFGYGTIGHLRLLGLLGADAVGVDVDPLLKSLYAKASDRGAYGKGSVTLLHGSWPKEVDAGGGYTLWLSKNVLKRGYIHPEQEVPKKQTIDLGVADAAFVASIHAALKPGGYVMIYNITPKPNGPGEKYRTWADGRCPFEKAMWTAAGFEILAYDQDDSAAVRAQGRALRWDEDVDLETSIFAMYTLLRRR